MNVTQEEIISVLRNLCIAVDVSNIKGDTSFSMAGVDSLDMMSVLLAIEEKYGIKISDDDAAALDSVDSIVGLLRHR